MRFGRRGEENKRIVSLTFNLLLIFSIILQLFSSLVSFLAPSPQSSPQASISGHLVAMATWATEQRGSTLGHIFSASPISMCCSFSVFLHSQTSRRPFPSPPPAPPLHVCLYSHLSFSHTFVSLNVSLFVS